MLDLLELIKDDVHRLLALLDELASRRGSPLRPEEACSTLRETPLSASGFMTTRKDLIVLRAASRAVHSCG